MPAIGLTLRLAGVVTLVLLLLGTPIAWWLARTRSRWRGVIGALVALPLVLPPSVLGFYVLLAMGPNGPLGPVTAFMGIDRKSVVVGKSGSVRVDGWGWRCMKKQQHHNNTHARSK